MDVMYKFESIGHYHDRGIGLVYFVKNPVECIGFAHLINKNVMIDCDEYIIKGVESHAIALHAKGEKIGLLVEKLQCCGRDV